MYTVGSLFAGIGGLCLGFKNAGAKMVWANEIDKYACQTYRKNLCQEYDYLVEGDIREIKAKDIPPFDILTAGFPCQAFSIAGNREGFKDDRGNLFFQVIKVLKAVKPRAFLLENVKNLKGHDKGRTFKRIKEELESLGYKITDKILSSMEYGGVPQDRERIYIVGFKSEAEIKAFKFPDPIPLDKSFRDILEKEKVAEKYYYNRFPIYEEIKKQMTKDTVYQWRRVYLRENKTGVCPTLTANMGTGGHNVPLIVDHYGEIRKFTPKETARLQGFPEWFEFPVNDSQAYKQCGNAVTVTVAERIAKNIIEVLDMNLHDEYRDIVAEQETGQLEIVI